MRGTGASGNSKCCVCDSQPADAGSLACEHGFCHDCFGRYVNGSLDELSTRLRCCVCGACSRLAVETRDETVAMSFGRDFPPRLRRPTALAVRRSTGEFVLVDRASERVLVFDANGLISADFAYVYDTLPMTGLTVTDDDCIVVPARDRGYRCLSFYTLDGAFLRSTYVAADAVIEGVAVAPGDWLVVADSANACVHLIDDRRRFIRSASVDQQPGDSHRPCLAGVAVNSVGEIIVSDSANDCVRVLDADARWRFSVGSRGERPAQFNCPRGVAVDADDNILVADSRNNRVQELSATGKFRRYVVRYNRGDDVYMSPIDVATRADGSVAVLMTGVRDSDVGEVRIYASV